MQRNVHEWLKYSSQVICILFVILSPWMLGSVSWESQRILLLCGFGLGGVLLTYLLACKRRGISFPKVPWLSWMFLGLAIMATVQSLPLFRRDSTSSLAPPSVAIQRWALGLSSASPVDESLLVKDFQRVDSESPCDDEINRDKKLAWSIEPLHSQGAVGALLLCALMSWSGALLFSDRNGQVTLLITLTAIGLAVSCFGFLGAYSYQEENFLGLKTGGSFSSFRSKNSAGAFLNICLAGCMGLVAWTLIHLRRKKIDIRYQVSDASFMMRLRGAVEDFLSDLNTPQIASIICLVVISIALIISQCRGAVVSAVAALITVLYLTKSQRKRFGISFVPVIVLFAAIAAVTAFQIDENSLERLESLSEYDLEEDAIKGRVYIWSLAWTAMKHYGLLGSGLGTFHYAYLPFQTPTSPSWFYHAESLYFQCGVDLGFLGLAVVLVAIFAAARKLQAQLPSETWKALTPIRVAGAFLFFSQCIHSSVDFGLILPALFIPACLLLGATLESLSHVRKVVERMRDQRETAPQDHSSRSIQKGSMISGICLLIVFGMLGYLTKPRLDNLAAGETLTLLFRKIDDLPPSKREPNSLNTLLGEWRLDSEQLKNNPDALRALADISLQDFRINLLLNSPASTNWDAAWGVTDPLLLQLGLDRETTREGQTKILQAAGGNEAVRTLERASQWYSLAQNLSPLDWRLSWGRCRTSLNCSRQNMSALLPVVVQLSRHSTKQLIESSLLFRKQLKDHQVDAIWAQAMKTKPSSAIPTARMMLEERDVETLDISVFPSRSEILRSLATSVFTKDKYPNIHRQLWEKAKENLDRSQLTKAGQAIWLADAASALGDLNEEVSHLKIATSLEPRDFKLACRLGMRLLDLDDVEGAKAIYQKWERDAAGEGVVQALGQRLYPYRR